MKYLLFLFTIILFTLQGCSSNEAHLKASESTLGTKNSSSVIAKSTSDEFETEFQAKETTGNRLDPLSGYNRVMTSFNDGVITYALNPVSKAYATVVPKPVRTGLLNFVKNINFPIRFANNLLQGKITNSIEELERFLVNSTVGVGGLMDVATNHLNLPAHKEDFGQTLGFYGVGPGFHIVLPFFGPSNVRDSLSLISANAYLSPLIYFKGLDNFRVPHTIGVSALITTGHFINKNSLELGKYESLKKDAVDLYPFLRDIYEEKRVSEIAE